MTRSTSKPDRITLVYPYYDNGGMLDHHLGEWDGYADKHLFKAIIVDDGSPEDPAEDHLKGVDVGIEIELYRINEDIPWNQDGARNLGMTHASGWCLLTDIDHVLDRDSAKALLSRKYSTAIHYIPSRKRPNGDKYHRHPNTYFLTHDLYWKTGGYDESFRGYYGTDSVFRRQLESVSKRKLLDIPLTLYGRDDIPDASTTRYGRKGSEYYIDQSPFLRDRRKNFPGPIIPLNFKWTRVL